MVPRKSNTLKSKETNLNSHSIAVSVTSHSIAAHLRYSIEVNLLLRRTIVNRNYGLHKNLYV